LPAPRSSCYRRALAPALDAKVASIAFPAISCGIYGYPPEPAVEIAVREVAEGARAMPSLRQVVFACFGSSVLAAYQRQLRAID
jgi:O-acetyl-ADP-ribose deacetylase (regulator of RNase III)